MALAISTASVLVFALLDSATITNRFSGRTATGRSLWLHTFSIALLSCAAIVAVGHVSWKAHGARVRLLLVATAAANLTVPALALIRPDDGLGAVVPLAHGGVAAALTTLASTMRERSVPPEGR